MSFYGFDLLDGITIGRYVSDDEETNQSREQPSQEESRVSEAEELRPPVATIDVTEDYELLNDDDDDLMSASGITILSSAPSNDTVNDEAAAAPAPVIFALSPATHRLSTEHALSLSTQESIYTDVRSISTRSSFLSLHPSSIPSSVISTNLSLRQSDGHDGQVFLRVANNRLASQKWYNHLENEQDWEVFCDQALQILVALGEPVESADMAVAQLIQREEEIFWKDETTRQAGFRSKALLALGEVALILATASLPLLGAVALRRY